MAPQYKLTYFNNRALAEPVRLLFALKGIEYEDVRVTREEWPALKPNAEQYPWGSLPVLQEGDKVLAQSTTILRYLARKFNLIGSDEFEAAKCDELADAMTDYRQAFFKPIFEKDEAKKEELTNTLKNETTPKYLSKFDAILKSNGTGFFVGKNVTHADLYIATFLEIFSEGQPGLLDSYENVKAHQQKIFNLDGIKEWVSKRPKTEF